jgi:glutamine synthetase
LRGINKKIKFEETGRKSVLFGSNVFNDKAMKQYLTSDAFKGVQGAVQHGTKIDRKLADYIAMGMKEWALSKGNSHYTWFQPTGQLLKNTMLSLKHHMTVVIL